LAMAVSDDVDYFSNVLALTASIFLSAISVGTGIIFLLHENNQPSCPPGEEKKDPIIDIAAWVFIIWGTHKGFYNYVTPDFNASSWNYISSIFLTNILNIALILVHSAKSNFEITESERLYRLLAVNSRDAIAKISLLPKPNFVYISPAVREITGYCEEDFYGQSNFFLGIIAEEDRPRYREYLQGIREIDSKITFQMRRKDKAMIWIEQHSTLVRDEGGTPLYVEAILRDVSDRILVEENLFNSEISRRKLLANISHELKSPITSIIGYLSVIQDNLLSTPQEALKFVKTCLDKSITLNELIQDLFELSKLEAKQLTFQYEKVSAAEYFLGAFNRYKTDIEKAGATAEYEFFGQTAEEIYVTADKRRLDQVFYNIVVNALNHMDRYCEIKFQYNIKSGFHWPEINKDRDSYVVFAVRDSGTGIPKKELSLIFRRFYRSRSSTGTGGTGLGLAISKEIVDLHDGIIWAESRSRKGATLYVALPKASA
ncbi:MAG TPA: PAS domain-containing sensor histidine kinase, partial [Anaerovoracaceae bacterium]|nr:PAS domain-containing sensor histidine kinase [Anaerovoracaceae bacterium]